MLEHAYCDALGGGFPSLMFMRRMSCDDLYHRTPPTHPANKKYQIRMRCRS